MIIKVIFPDFTMLFGDSYKGWEEQVSEYMNRMAQDVKKPISVEISQSKFIAWGGLKWANEETFQQQLNREGCQANEPDNPKPRQYSSMKFVKNEKAFAKVLEFWKKGQRLLKINKLNASDYELYNQGKLKITVE